MAKHKRPLVLADSNIYVAGVLFPRVFYEVLQHAAKGDIELVISPYIIQEVTRNLARWLPEKSFLERLSDLLLAIEPIWIENPYPRELKRHRNLVASAKDLPIALAAVNAKVAYLITNDKVFHQAAAIKGLKRRGVTVITAEQFLRKAMGWEESDLHAIRERKWNDL